LFIKQLKSDIESAFCNAISYSAKIGCIQRGGKTHPQQVRNVDINAMRLKVQCCAFKGFNAMGFLFLIQQS